MINKESTDKMSKVTAVSFLQSHVTAATAALSLYVPLSGPYNDAVLELNRINYLLAQAQLRAA